MLEIKKINGKTVKDETARNSITELQTQIDNIEVPTKTSDLTNDSDFVNSTFVTNKIAEASLNSGEVDLSGYVTKETGNASQITFSDGQTFQAKLDAGILKGDQGEKGDVGQDGQTPNITIGTVTTLTANSNATAEITGTTPNLTLNLGIPRGADGVGGSIGNSSYNHKLNRYKFIANPPYPLDIITYAGGRNQPTHPSVKYFKDGFNGYKYWMAYTPFPGNNNAEENPCITYSNDGYTWSEEGIQNPIEPVPTENDVKVGFNSDVELVYVNNKLECWWRTCYQNGTNKNHEVIYRKTSTDGINWSNKEELFRVNDVSLGSAMSPVVIYEDNIYKIWIAYKQECLKYYTSTDGTNWEYVRDIIVDNDDNINYKIWHFDIIHTELGYEFVGCYHPKDNYNDNKYIYYAVSQDNIAYSKRKLILTTGYEGSYDEAELYRPSLVKNANGYMLYYGCRDNSKSWKIAMVEFLNINHLINMMNTYKEILSGSGDSGSGDSGSGDSGSEEPVIGEIDFTNLFEITNIEKENGYYNPSGGAWTPSATYISTSYVPVEPYKRVIRNSNEAVVFFDSDKNFISSATFSTAIIETPSNAAYMTTHFKRDLLNANQLKFGYLNSTPVPNVDKNTELFDASTSNINSYYNTSTKQFVASDTYNCTDYIPVFPFLTLKMTNVTSYAFFDENKVKIGGTSNAVLYNMDFRYVICNYEKTKVDNVSIKLT